ncbi:unnamed protein product, partial [Hapterophycus canaliculatus]
RWIRRWFEVEDRVLYCYNAQEQEESKVKRAAVLYQASVKDTDYKNGKYPHYFEVHSPMGIMRLRAEDAAGKNAWISSLQKQAQAMPPVAHLYAQDGPSTGGITANRDVDPSPAALGAAISSSSTSDIVAAAAAVPAGSMGTDTTIALQLHRRPGSITEGDETLLDTDDGEGGSATGLGKEGQAAEEVGAAARAAAGKLLAGTAKERQSAMSMSTVVLQEAKRNKRFRFFNEERQFVSDLTDVCEALRFVEPRSERNPKLEALLMKVKVPECAYLPLCRSTEPFQRVIKITPNEARAFNTKARRCSSLAW